MTIMASGMVSRMSFRWASRASASCALAAAALRERRNIFAAPRSADADQHEDESVDDVRGRQRAIIGDEEQPHQQAEKGGEYAGPHPPSADSDQDRRHIE